MKQKQCSNTFNKDFKNGPHHAPWVYYTKWSKSERENQLSYINTYIWNLDCWQSRGQQEDQTSQFLGKSVLNTHWKDWCWSWNSSTLATWCLTLWKRLWCWDGINWLNGHEFEQAPGVGDRQGSLACCSPWGCKELDTTERLNWTEAKETNLTRSHRSRKWQSDTSSPTDTCDLPFLPLHKSLCSPASTCRPASLCYSRSLCITSVCRWLFSWFH